MGGKNKKGTLILAVLCITAAVISVICASLAILFSYVLTYDPMLIATGVSISVSAISAYTVPFFLSAMFTRINMDKIIKKATELGTTDAGEIAVALSWRIKKTKRLVKKCIRKNYI